MEINNKKNHLSRIIIFFIMLLFAMCLTMNLFFSNNYNLYNLLDKATVIETRTISESIVANEDGDHTAYFNSLFLNKNTSHSETITKNICPTPMNAAIPKGFCLLLVLIIVFLFFFLNLFVLLPDRWTLVYQKVRLDN